MTSEIQVGVEGSKIVLIHYEGDKKAVTTYLDTVGATVIANRILAFVDALTDLCEQEKTR